MPRYYMNLRDQDGLTQDLEGDDFPDIVHARDDALFAAKQMVAELLKGGRTLEDALSRTIEITDDSGEVLATVSFADGAAADLRDMSPQERAKR